MKCKICDEIAVALCRGVNVCNIHYTILKRDNLFRSKTNQEIPNNLIILKSCARYNCSNTFPFNLMNLTENNQSYCSNICKIRNNI